MRIAKFMAAAGVASRRKCEELIFEGKVKVNGIVISEPGTQVDPENDEVRVGNRKIVLSTTQVYIMLNKPSGCVSTCTDDKGRMTVLDCLPQIKERIYPVGRLDFMTEGLLLLTNDGDFAQRLTHPRNEVSKSYVAAISGTLSEDEIRQLERGVFIEGGKTAPARIKVTKSAPSKTELVITIHEGRNHQVRKMFEAVEKNVIYLKRIAEGGLELGTLKKGEYRNLTKEEVAMLMK